MKFIDNDLFDTRASLGIVKDYFNTPNKVQDVDFDLDILMDMVNSDPVLSTALDITVDLTTYNGYSFITDSDKLKNQAINLFNNTYDFDQVIDNIIYSLIIYGDAYLELRYLGNRIKELHPLESSEMRIRYDEHGRVLGYVQKPRGSSIEEIPFTTDEIIHFRLKWIGSKIYSYSPFESISKAYSTRIYANNYLQSIFKNMPPKMFWILKNANKDQRALFIQNLIRSKSNPNIDVVALGDSDSKINQVNFDNGLIKVLEYLRSEILMITRVPPLWVGITEGANRSSSEAMIIPFETRIKKLQQKIASAINRELMPKIGLKNVFFKFNPISLTDEKILIEIARNIKDMGFNPEAATNYLKNKGFELGVEDHILTIDEINSSNNENNLTVGKKDEKGFNSRKRMDKKTDKINSEINKKGISEKGTQKLEIQKMNMRASLPDSSKYWTWINPNK